MTSNDIIIKEKITINKRRTTCRRLRAKRIDSSIVFAIKSSLSIAYVYIYMLYIYVYNIRIIYVYTKQWGYSQATPF